MSNIKKGYTADVVGILDINDVGIFVEVKDIEEPINLSEFIADFNGKEVKISIAYKQEL